MTRPGGAAQRVDAPRRSLHCSACGAGNPLTAEARQHGWFRCIWCESPEPVPGVGDFAVQGPAGRVTRIVRPGSSEFETEDSLVLPVSRGVAWVALADLLVAGLLHGLERADPLLAAALAPVLVGVLAGVGGCVLLGQLTRQRLTVAEDRVDLWWVTLGRAWRHRHLKTRRFHTSAYLKGRTGVEIRAPGRRLMLYMTGRESIRWLERELIAAVKDARRREDGSRLPCPGCGGPVAEEKVLRDAGALECPHCKTGLVETGGGIAMPAPEIHHDLDVEEAELPQPRREGDRLVWTAVPWCRTYPKATPINVLLALLLDAALIGGSWWGVFHAPMLQVVAGGLALGVTLACLHSSRCFFENVFGRSTFRLGPRTLEYELRVGPWVRRRDPIPLARLVSLEARLQTYEHEGERYPGSGVEIEARLASKTLELEPYGRHLIPVVAAVVAALAARLEEMGRAPDRRGHVDARGWGTGLFS